MRTDDFLRIWPFVSHWIRNHLQWTEIAQAERTQRQQYQLQLSRTFDGWYFALPVRSVMSGDAIYSEQYSDD